MVETELPFPVLFNNERTKNSMAILFLLYGENKKLIQLQIWHVKNSLLKIQTV